MLLITFNIADGRYAIDTRSVIEIVPMVKVKEIPMEETYVSGIFNYHGEFVPVIDISRLCTNHDSRRSLTTRMILARLDNGKILGLIAENITQTINISPADFSSCGISKLKAEFLGNVTHDNGDIIQFVNLNQLLGSDIKSRLYEIAEAS